MAVNKAELYTGFGIIQPDTVPTEENSFNSIQINPFVKTEATSAPLPRDSKGHLLFGNELVSNTENAITKKSTFTLSEKFNPVNYLRGQLASYCRSIQNWDRAVDPDAAGTISRNWPSYSNIQMAVSSNPRLAYLAQQANKDYV